jgi:hypothetical protein
MVVARVRLLASCAAAVALSSCTGGIDAGEKGGIAFIVFAVMLVVMGAVLFLFIGKSD